MLHLTYDCSSRKTPYCAFYATDPRNTVLPKSKSIHRCLPANQKLRPSLQEGSKRCVVYEILASFCRTVSIPDRFVSHFRNKLDKKNDLPVTPCVMVLAASVFLFPKLTVVTFFTVCSLPNSFAHLNIHSSSRPSPATIKKSTGDVYDILGGMCRFMRAKIFLAAVALFQSIGSTITAPIAC